MDNVSWLSAICGIVTLLILWAKWSMGRAAARKKEQEDEDKRIDSAVTSDDLLREFDRLRDK